MRFFIGGILILIIVACRPDSASTPLPPYLNFTTISMEIPEDNSYSPVRAELGRELFFDSRLSLDSSIRCASCHLPGRAFSDTVAISPGVGGELGFRNSPSLINIGYHPYFMREGGVPTLELQVLVPLEEHAEMAFNIVALTERLAEDEEYQQMAQQAYGRPLDPYVITRSLANFERTLVGGTSDFDAFLRGKDDALSDAAKRGMDLFYSDRLHCSTCHSGYLLSGFGFEHNKQDTIDADLGRARLTGLAEDRYLYKVPSLRNVAVTAPYFHDGSYPTLRSVLDHYNAGGSEFSLDDDDRIRPLGLSEQEINDLEAFLNSLTDR